MKLKLNFKTLCLALLITTSLGAAQAMASKATEQDGNISGAKVTNIMTKRDGKAFVVIARTDHEGRMLDQEIFYYDPNDLDNSELTKEQLDELKRAQDNKHSVTVESEGDGKAVDSVSVL